MINTVLVTGCSSGIGYHTINVLKAKGYRVFATARKQADVDHLKKLGFAAFKIDLNDSHSIQQGLQEILTASQGRIDALINNAGYGQPGALEDLNREIMREQFETNVFGLHELTNLVLAVMRKQGYGRIIHMSSVLGFVSLPYRGAYCASKYAVEGLADALRLELRDTNIKVSLIEPGPIFSEFRNNALSAYFEAVDVEKSYHRDNYQRFIENFKKYKGSKLGKPPEAVTRKILHALQSSNPKIRYYVTLPTYFIAILKRILPSRVLDWILKKASDQEIKG